MVAVHMENFQCIQPKCQGPLQLLSPPFLMTNTTKQMRPNGKGVGAAVNTQCSTWYFKSSGVGDVQSAVVSVERWATFEPDDARSRFSAGEARQYRWAVRRQGLVLRTVVDDRWRTRIGIYTLFQAIQRSYIRKLGRAGACVSWGLFCSCAGV